MSLIALQDYLRYVEGLLDENRLDEAAAHCYSILQQQPRHVATYRLFGRVLLEQQKYPQAIDLFQRVLSADPEDLISHAGLAEVYRATDDLPLAIWHMERAFEIQPYNRALQAELKYLYEVRDGSAPRQLPLTRAALARLYVRGGHFRLAADELRALLKEQPDRADLRVLLAEALYWDGRRIEAAGVSANVAEELPDSIKANAILAEVWSSGGRVPEARTFIQRLWGLTLLNRSERDNEALVGRALSNGGFAEPPDEVMVEQLDYLHASVEETVEGLEQAGVLAPVAVKELPGWLDDIEDELALSSDTDANSSAEVKEESDWSVQPSVASEIAESPEPAVEERIDTLESTDVDSESGFVEEAVESFPTQEMVDDQELPEPVESIDAETALLLESETIGDAEIRPEQETTGELGNDATGTDEPIEPAPTLAGEENVVQEERPAGDPEQPVESFDLEEAPARESEEEVEQQATGAPIADNILPQDDATAEPELSSEDLFLESIVAEAFGEVESTESEEDELPELVLDDRGASALESLSSEEDVSLHEMAAEAFEQEIAAEVEEETAPESGAEAQDVATPEREHAPEVPIAEETPAVVADEAEPDLPHDEGDMGTDLLFAALAAREMKDELGEEVEESTSASEIDASTLTGAEATDEEIGPETIDAGIKSADFSLEDNIFESLATDADADEPVGWPESTPESDVGAGDYDGGLDAWVQEPIDEDGVIQPAAAEAVPFDDLAGATEEFPEEDGPEDSSEDVGDEIVALGPSDIVTKEFDGPPDYSIDPAKPFFDEAAEGTGEMPLVSRAQEATFEDVGPSQETVPPEPPAGDDVLDSSEFETALDSASDDWLGLGQSGDNEASAGWLDDLSEEASDDEDLPDWLYDAIGFTGELDKPDDYEEPDWLREFGGEAEEPLPGDQQAANAKMGRQQTDEPQGAARDETETTASARARSVNQEDIPDWLQDAGGSLEELPSDLAENLNTYASDLSDEDEGALSWLDALAAESADTDKSEGLESTVNPDSSATEDIPSQPNEPPDDDRARR